MGEIQPLNYNPMQTGLQAMQYLQNQQHLALQQQSIENQGRNMQVDNLQKALAVAGPMDGYPIYKQLMEMQGQQAPSVEAYLASNPRSQAQRGYKKLAKAGLGDIGNDDDVAAAVGQSHPLQGKIGEVLARTPEEQMRYQEHKNLVDNFNAQTEALLPISKQAQLGIERSAPLVAQLAAIQQEYDKNAKSKGINYAAGIRRDKILANPELEQFNLRSQQSIEGLTQQVQQIEDMQTQLSTQAELIAQGVKPLPEGQSIFGLAGRVDASVKHLALVKAQLAFAKDKSPANFEALKAAQQGIDTHLAQLNEKKNASQDAIALRQAGLDERKLEYADKKARQAAIGKAQVEWFEAGGNPENAYKFAKKYGLHVDEVTQGAKKPNAPLVEVKMPGTTEEAGKFSMINNAVKSVQAVRAAITKQDGTVDRGKVFSASLNIPFTEGRNISSMMEDAVSAKLRAETGAAANADEVKSILRRFDLSSFDTDDVMFDKLNRLERFLNDTRVIRDSSGKIREVVAQDAKEKQAPPQTSGHAKVRNEAEYNALPSGSVYIAPDGSTRTKR